MWAIWPIPTCCRLPGRLAPRTEARAANVDVNITLADMLCVQQTVRSKPAVAKLLRGMSRGLRVRYAEPAPACIRIPAEVHTKFRSVNSTSKFISASGGEGTWPRRGQGPAAT